MMNLENENKKKEVENLLKKQYYLTYFFDPTQYDLRTFRILSYFHKNNEPLFYLALSYTSKMLIYICLFIIFSFLFFSFISYLFYL